MSACLQCWHRDLVKILHLEAEVERDRVDA
jgi:hypothetical protein